MSTQYANVNKSYCSSCQNVNEYPNDIKIQLTECVAVNEFITNKSYNEIIESLQQIQNFGEADSATRQPLNANNITLKNKEQTVTIADYNEIMECLYGNKNHDKNQSDIILGTYFEDLIKNIKGYKIPNTRYYNCVGQSVYDCCDCYGECYCYAYDCYEWCKCYSSGNVCWGECGSYGDCGETHWS